MTRDYLQHRGHRSREYRGHLNRAQPSADQDERPDSGVDQCLPFEGTCPDSFVLGHHHPAALSDRAQPDDILRALREVIVVLFDASAAAPSEGFRDELTCQVGVREEG
jgi:hypothetical protein